MKNEEIDKKSTVQSYDTLYANPATYKQTSKSAFRVSFIVTAGIFVILIVVIVLGFTSCSKRDEKSVLRYLKSRYGEEFVVTDTESDANESGGSETMFYYTTTAYCYPVSNPDCVFKTKLKHNRDSAFTITDNYAAVLVSRQMGVAFQEKLGDRFGDAAVYTECNATLGDDAVADPAGYLHDYIADADAKPLRIHYYVVVNLDTYTAQDYDTEFDELSRALTELCEETHTDGDLSIEFGTQKWYDRKAEWRKTHTPSRALPDSFGVSKEYTIYDELFCFEYYQYHFETHKMEPFSSSKDASTMREDYIADREKCLEKLKDMG